MATTKWTLLGIMGAEASAVAPAGARCVGSKASVECLRDWQLPGPDLSPPRKRHAAAEGGSAGRRRPVGRPPLAELPREGDRERGCNTKDGAASRTPFGTQAIGSNLACSSKEQEARAARAVELEDAMHDEQRSGPGFPTNAERTCVGDSAVQHVRCEVLSWPWSAFGGCISSHSFSTASRTSYIQAIISGSVAPPLELLWMAHSRGVMPLEEVVLQSSDALHKSLAETLRKSCVAAMRQRDRTCGQRGTVGSSGRECHNRMSRSRAREPTGDAAFLTQLLSVLAPLAIPPDGPRGRTCEQSGDDVRGRVSRKCLAIFDAICCPPPGDVATHVASQAQLQNGALEYTLAFLLAVSDASHHFPSGRCSQEPSLQGDAGSGARQTLQELARYRLKHLRVPASTNRAAASQFSAASQAKHATPPPTEIAAKSHEFWRVAAASAGPHCGDRADAEGLLLEEAASVFMQLCGLFLRHVSASAVVSPSEAAAKRVRDLIDDMARSALLEADQMALSSSILLMLFLSSSPPMLLRPHPLLASVDTARSGSQWSGNGSAGSGRMDGVLDLSTRHSDRDDQGGSATVFASLKSWCVHDRWVKQLIFGGLAVGSAGAMTIKRCGPLVLQVLQALVDCAAWPLSPQACWHEERSLRLHLLSVADATLLRSSVRDFSSLARARLSDLNSRRIQAAGTGVAGAAAGLGRGVGGGHAIPGGWGAFEDFRAQLGVKTLGVAHSHAERSKRDRAGAPGAPGLGGDDRSPSPAAEPISCHAHGVFAGTDASAGDQLEQVFAALAVAVESSHVGDAEEAMRGACASVRGVACREYEAALTESQKLATATCLARHCVEGCVNVFVAHLRRSANVRGPRQAIGSGESGDGALIWLLPIANMLGRDAGGEDAEDMGGVLHALGSCMRAHVERLLLEKLAQLVPVQVAALSALALALANVTAGGLPQGGGVGGGGGGGAYSGHSSSAPSPAHHSEDKAWLYRMLLRLVAMSARPAALSSREGSFTESEELSGGAVELCMGLIMSAISLHTPIYLSDETGAACVEVGVGTEPRSGIVIPRLALDVVLLFEQLASAHMTSSFRQGGAHRGAAAAFWSAWASAKLLPLRRAAGRVPFKTWVLLCSTGFVPALLNWEHAGPSGHEYIGRLKGLLADAAERPALDGSRQGGTAAAARRDRAWIQSYAEAFADLATSAGGEQHADAAHLGGALAGGASGAKDLLLILFSEDTVVKTTDGVMGGAADGVREVGGELAAGGENADAHGMFAPSCEAGALMQCLRNGCISTPALACARGEQACLILDLLPLPRLLNLFGVECSHLCSSSYAQGCAAGGGGEGGSERKLEARSAAWKSDWQLASGRALGAWVEACLGPCFGRSSWAIGAHMGRSQEANGPEKRGVTAARRGGECYGCRYPLAVCRLLVRVLCALYDLAGDCEEDVAHAASRTQCKSAGEQQGAAGMRMAVPRGMVGKGMVQSSTFAADCLLLHLHAVTDMSAQRRVPGLASVCKSWRYDEELSVLVLASHVAHAIAQAGPLPPEVKSSVARLVWASSGHRDVLARALALRAVAAAGGRPLAARNVGGVWLAQSVEVVTSSFLAAPSTADGSVGRGMGLHQGAEEVLRDFKAAVARHSHAFA